MGRSLLDAVPPLLTRRFEVFREKSLSTEGSGLEIRGFASLSLSLSGLCVLLFLLVFSGAGISTSASLLSKNGSWVFDNQASIFDPRFGTGCLGGWASGLLNIFLDSSTICPMMPPLGGFAGVRLFDGAGPRARRLDNSEKSASLAAHSES
jgi:hypothetical protein